MGCFIYMGLSPEIVVTVTKRPFLNQIIDLTGYKNGYFVTAQFTPDHSA